MLIMNRRLVTVLVAAALSSFLSCHKSDGGAPMLAAAPPSTAASSGPKKADSLVGKQIPAKQDPRKIVYRGEVRLVVKAYKPARKAIDDYLAKSGGYISSSQVRHRVGRVSSATLVLRIPAGQFSDILKQIGNLGIIVRESTSAEDITEKYFDLKARLDNAKKLEKRLLQLMAKEAGKVAELLKVEKELARVREKIEVLTGKLRLFDKLVSFSTLTVHFDIREKYVPPKPPTLGNKIQRMLAQSFDAVCDFGEGLLLLLVALIPWTPVILVPVIGGIVLIRRRRRKREAASKAVRQ
jgi:hypothetical protein